MIRILDTSSQRLLKILNLLLKKESWLTIEYLSIKLGVSEKTIHDDLILIQENWSSTVGLEFINSHKVRANKLSISIFLHLQSIILLQSIPIKFLNSIIYYPNKNLIFHSEHLHLSLSTFYRHLPKINNYLKNFDIEIQNNQSFFSLTSSNELGLRHFVTTFFLEISDNSPEIFISKEIRYFLKNRIKRLYKKNNETLSNEQISFLTVLYFVSIHRELQGFPLKHLSVYNGIHSEFSNEENNLLNDNKFTLSVETMKKIEGSLLILNSNYNRHSDKQIISILSYSLDQLLNLLELNVPIENYNKLLNQLENIYLNETCISIPYYLSYSRFSLFTYNLEKENPSVIQIIQDFINEITLLTKISFVNYSDFIIYNLAIYFPEIISEKEFSTILIISKYSKQHAEFLLSVIESEIIINPMKIKNIQCIYITDVNDLILNQNQLIISNSKALTNRKNGLHISDYPTDNDIYQIKKRLLNPSKNYKTKISDKNFYYLNKVNQTDKIQLI